MTNINIMPDLELSGLSVSAGIGIGQIVIYRTDLDDVNEYPIGPLNIIDEIERYLSAVNEITLIFLNNQKTIEQEIGKESASIYETYLVILEDPFFQEEIPEAIRKEHRNAEFIIRQKVTQYEKHFDKIEDEYLRERIFDIRGVSRRLIYHLLQTEYPQEPFAGRDNIIVARELTPADTIHFHHSSLKGIVTEFGGRTSHAAILARSIEVPALVGVKDILKKVKNGTHSILDGSDGKLILEPSKRTIQKYQTRQKEFFKKKEKLISSLYKPISHLQNRTIRLLANINEPVEVELALRYKADGIGLFRTELQFIAKERFLSEEEQYELYKGLLEQNNSNEVVIRVLDLGGDKFLPFTDLHRESNPFLGWRSVRILLSEKEVFKKQVKAIYRAGLHGEAKILIPMISSLEEIVACKKIITEAQNEMRKHGVEFNPDVPLGIMVEIPSAAIIIEKLIPLVDFISIGTNDLIQYTLAVDRNNEKVAQFYQPLNEAVLHLIKQVARICNKHKKYVSVCGEMAGDPIYTQLLLALGVNNLSMQPAAIPLIKNIILNTTEEVLTDIEKKLFTFSDIKLLREYLFNHVKQLIH